MLVTGNLVTSMINYMELKKFFGTNYINHIANAYVTQITHYAGNRYLGNLNDKLCEA